MSNLKQTLVKGVYNKEKKMSGVCCLTVKFLQISKWFYMGHWAWSISMMYGASFFN